MSGCQSVPYCFGITLTLTSGISPILLAVGIPNLVCRYILGLQSVTQCLYITLTSTSGLIYENVLSLWTFCHTLTQFMILRNNQLSNSTIQSFFYRLYNPFLTLKKRSNCIKSISTLSLSIQHPIQGKQTLLLPKEASLYLMTVPVFELLGTTSNMYFVHVNLMNSVLYLL